MGEQLKPTPEQGHNFIPQAGLFIPEGAVPQQPAPHLEAMRQTERVQNIHDIATAMQMVEAAHREQEAAQRSRDEAQRKQKKLDSLNGSLAGFDPNARRPELVPSLATLRVRGGDGKPLDVKVKAYHAKDGKPMVSIDLLSQRQKEKRTAEAVARQAHAETLPAGSKERLKAVKQEAIRKLFGPEAAGPRYSPSSVKTDDGADRYVATRFNPDTGEIEYVDVGAALIGYEAITPGLKPSSKEEIAAVEHIQHAAHKAEKYRTARNTIETPLFHRLMPKQVGLTDAQAGYDDKKLDEAIKYDRKGYVAADQNAPGLLTYKQIPLQTRLEMLIRSPGLPKAQKRMQQKRLDGIRKNQALEDKWMEIGVIHEGHHRKWSNPVRWAKGPVPKHKHESEPEPDRLEEATEAAHGPVERFISSATPEELETFNKLKDYNDPDRIDAFVEKAGDRLHLSNELKAGIKAVGNVQREAQIKQAEALMEAKLAVARKAKLSRDEKKVLENSILAYKNGGLAAIENYIANRPGASMDLRAVLETSAYVLRKKFAADQAKPAKPRRHGH